MRLQKTGGVHDEKSWERRAKCPQKIVKENLKKQQKTCFLGFDKELRLPGVDEKNKFPWLNI